MSFGNGFAHRKAQSRGIVGFARAEVGLKNMRQVLRRDVYKRQASTRVTKEFHLSQEQYGDMELAFGWAFAVGSLIFGFLADRFRVYWLYPVVLSGWSLMGIASAQTEGYWPLLTCRVLLGFFEAGHWPCALKTTFALLEPKDRTMGNSVLQSGASIGAVVTPPLMLWLMTDELSSWRLAFEALSLIHI